MSGPGFIVQKLNLGYVGNWKFTSLKLDKSRLGGNWKVMDMGGDRKAFFLLFKVGPESLYNWETSNNFLFITPLGSMSLVSQVCLSLGYSTHKEN